MRALPLVLLAALALASRAPHALGQAGADGGAPGRPAPADALGGWCDVVLPEGFALVLATGEVTTRPAPGARGLLRWADGRLVADVALEHVTGPAPPARGAARVFLPSARVARPAPEGAAAEAAPGGTALDPFADAGAPASAGRVVQLGDELAFDLRPTESAAGTAEPTGWGYLRVLDREPSAVTLETLFVPPAAGSAPAAVEREPATLSVRPAESGVALAWPAVAGARYCVERRIVGAAGAPAWRALGTVDVADGEGRFVDETDLAGRLAEYRVARTDGPGRVGFGSRARGTWPWWPIDEALELRQGQHVSLLAGECAEGVHDFQVDAVHPNGVQLTCAPGALVYSYGASARREWIVTPPELGQTRSERAYLPVARETSARLASGIYARLVLETSADGAVALRRQVDLEGGLLFPEPPAPPRAGWTERGVELAFEPFGRDVFGGPLDPPPAIVLEREEPFGSGEWAVAVAGPPGERALVDPVFPDAEAGPGGLWPVRYRARHRWLGRVDSLPSEPWTAVVGDDGGPRAEAAVRVALAWLGDADFERRRAARRLLEELGERVWPRLREALGSDDPDVATAVAEILRRSGERRAADRAGAGGAAADRPPAPLVLRAHAEERGITSEPPPGLLAPEALERARALLATRATVEADALAWRGVLADGDPEPGVRLLARMLADRESDPLAELATWRAAAGAPGAGTERRRLALGLADWTALFADEPGLDRTRRLVEAALDPARPRTALVLLNVLWRLAVARADGEDAAEALERAQLALSLVHAWETLSEPVYLDAALRLFDDPRVRLRALRDLADLRLGRLAGPDTAPGRTRDELAEPTLEALVARLEALSSAGLTDVDLVLPPGEYGDGRTVTSLEVPGLRLVGGEGVVLRTALRVGDVDGVVLDGLEVRSATSLALTVQDGSVLARDCTFEATNTHVQGYDAVVELVGCRFEPVEGRAVTGVRTAGASLLVVRDCVFDLESGAASVSGVGLLEGCTVTCGQRPAVDAAAGSWVALLDVYVRAEGVALSKLAAGLLVGVVVDGDAPAARGLGADVELCPKSVLATGSPGELATRERLPACPLER